MRSSSTEIASALGPFDSGLGGLPDATPGPRNRTDQLYGLGYYVNATAVDSGTVAHGSLYRGADVRLANALRYVRDYLTCDVDPK
jgi:hypothetical protein